ncbi:MAG: class I SAM-dependent methyltransferase [Candidatus Omnitrophica bacterium]|nr:class I SAM-dependent methyltransferase [Candidatus Omnitrophota bacterium]
MDSAKKNKGLKEQAYRFLSKAGIGIFQKVFPEYFAKEPLAPSDRYVEYPFVIKNLPKPPARVLDVGCSGSFFPLLLASFGYESYGVDNRPYPILNKIKFPNFTFIQSDIRKTSFADSYFDAVTAISTIEHIGIGGRYGMKDDLEGDANAVKEIIRILKPKGVALITVPFGKSQIIRPHMRVYDEIGIKRITDGLNIELAQYYVQDSTGDWCFCSINEAHGVDIKLDRYPLCCVKLKKE